MHPINFIKQRFFAPLTNMAQSAAGSFFARWNTPGQDRDLLRKYQGYVYSCVSAIAEDVAMINFQVFRQLQDGSLVEVKDNSLLKLLDKPNPLMSKYQLLEMTQTHIELTGEAFWYMELGEITGKPKSFYILPPDRMTVVIDRNASLPTIAGYVFTRENGQQIPLDPEEIVHFKMPNPWDPYRGYGTVEAALVYVQTERFGAEYTRNFIYNNAMPAGIVTIKGTIDKDRFDTLKRQWKQEYGSIEKAGKTAFVNGAEVNYTQIGSNLSDAAITELKQMTRDDIMTMFRVSKPILGIFEDVNLASAKTAQYVFMSRVIDPKMSRLVDALQSLMDRWNSQGTNYILGYDSPVPEDVDDKIKTYQAGINSWLTINEVRKEEGLQPLPGADTILLPLNLVPVGAPPSAAKGLSSGHKVVKRTITRKVVENKDLGLQKKENYRLELIGNQTQWAKRFVTSFGKILEKQKQEILDNWEYTESKAVVKALDQYGFDDSTGDFNDELTPLELELAKEQGQVALAFAGSDADFDLSPAVRDAIAARIERMAKNFNSATKDLLTKTLQEGIANNESLAQIKKRVEEAFDASKGYRAERVARTETLYGSNAAAVEAYQQTGYITNIEWLADSTACEYCSALDGTVVAIEQGFAPLGTQLEGDDGGIMNVDYMNIDYPPAHPNCECTTIPVVE